MFSTASFRKADYLLTTDRAVIDRQALYRLLAGSYWAADRSRDVIDRSLEHSLCFSLFHRDAMIGFARVVTDASLFAYLCDVVIAAEHRGSGLGKWLMECVLSHPDTRNIRKWLLATRDAHGFYRQHGFVPVAYPAKYMERY